MSVCISSFFFKLLSLSELIRTSYLTVEVEDCSYDICIERRVVGIFRGGLGLLQNKKGIKDSSLLLGLVMCLLVAALFDDDEGGLQFRKEVQILHGFPSGRDSDGHPWRGAHCRAT